MPQLRAPPQMQLPRHFYLQQVSPVFQGLCLDIGRLCALVVDIYGRHQKGLDLADFHARGFLSLYLDLSQGLLGRKTDSPKFISVLDKAFILLYFDSERDMVKVWLVRRPG